MVVTHPYPLSSRAEPARGIRLRPIETTEEIQRSTRDLLELRQEPWILNPFPKQRLRPHRRRAVEMSMDQKNNLLELAKDPWLSVSEVAQNLGVDKNMVDAGSTNQGSRDSASVASESSSDPRSTSGFIEERPQKRRTTSEVTTEMAKQSHSMTTNGRTQLPAQDVVCVDLFCGAGGLTHGLIDAGVRVVAGVDFAMG
jgi:transposase-like protein